MTAAPATETSPRARFATLLGLPLALLTVWLISQAYTTNASRQCLALYRAAHSAIDSASVDATIPDTPDNRGPEAHSCGFTRSFARWF